MTTITAPTITHRVVYAGKGDYDCYVTIDGLPELYIGGAENYLDGETKCLDYKHDLLADGALLSTAALDGGSGQDEIAAEYAAALPEPTFTVTSSVRKLTYTTTDLRTVQEQAWKLAIAEVMYLSGSVHAWGSFAKIEWIDDGRGTLKGCRVLKRDQGPLGAHITPHEVIATVEIDGDWAAVERERAAKERRSQEETVRYWLANGFEVPENYPVQPTDLPENQAIDHNLITPDPAECPDVSAPRPVEDLPTMGDEIWEYEPQPPAPAYSKQLCKRCGQVTTHIKYKNAPFPICCPCRAKDDQQDWDDAHTVTACERYSTPPPLALWGPPNPLCPKCDTHHDPIVACPGQREAGDVGAASEPEDPCAALRVAVADLLGLIDRELPQFADIVIVQAARAVLNSPKPQSTAICPGCGASLPGTTFGLCSACLRADEAAYYDAEWSG